MQATLQFLLHNIAVHMLKLLGNH